MVQVGAFTCPLNWISIDDPAGSSAMALFINGNSDNATAHTTLFLVNIIISLFTFLFM
jgi:hypothetical protein